MRKFYFSAFLLLFIVAKTFAQTGQVFNLNKLSKQDTLLSGWKFHPGNNPQWANPGFDDSKWQLADPGKGHGGSIQVDSVAGEGSEFIILLPIKIT